VKKVYNEKEEASTFLYPPHLSPTKDRTEKATTTFKKPSIRSQEKEK